MKMLDWLKRVDDAYLDLVNAIGFWLQTKARIHRYLLMNGSVVTEIALSIIQGTITEPGSFITFAIVLFSTNVVFYPKGPITSINHVNTRVYVVNTGMPLFRLMIIPYLMFLLWLSIYGAAYWWTARLTVNLFSLCVIFMYQHEIPPKEDHRLVLHGA